MADDVESGFPLATRMELSSHAWTSGSPSSVMNISPASSDVSHPSLDPDSNWPSSATATGRCSLVCRRPGAGKTACICLRALNLLLTRTVEPQHLLLCTFTRATAREMQERIYAMSQQAGYGGDITRMRIVTIHGLSLPAAVRPRRLLWMVAIGPCPQRVGATGPAEIQFSSASSAPTCRPWPSTAGAPNGACCSRPGGSSTASPTK